MLDVSTVVRTSADQIIKNHSEIISRWKHTPNTQGTELPTAATTTVESYSPSSMTAVPAVAFGVARLTETKT